MMVDEWLMGSSHSSSYILSLCVWQASEAMAVIVTTTNKSTLYTTPTITHSIVIKICLQLNHVIHSLKWALGVKDSIVSDNNAFFDTLVHQHKGGDGA